MKERLTGAIILVALIVLLVPELLTGPPRLKPAGTPSAGATVAAAPVHSYTLPLGPGARATALRLAASTAEQRDPAAPAEKKATSHASSTAASTPAPAAAPALHSVPPRQVQPALRTEPRPQVPPPPPTPSPVRPRAEPHHTVPTRHPAHTGPLRRTAHTPTRAARHASAGGRWTVQLGVFAVHDDALRMARRVRSKGFGVRVVPLHIRGRRLWRVSAQAEPTRAAALQLARRLRRAGIRGDLLRQ